MGFVAVKAVMAAVSEALVASKSVVFRWREVRKALQRVSNNV